MTKASERWTMEIALGTLREIRRAEEWNQRTL